MEDQLDGAAVMLFIPIIGFEAADFQLIHAFCDVARLQSLVKSSMIFSMISLSVTSYTAIFAIIYLLLFLLFICSFLYIFLWYSCVYRFEKVSVPYRALLSRSSPAIIPHILMVQVRFQKCKIICTILFYLISFIPVAIQASSRYGALMRSSRPALLSS